MFNRSVNAGALTAQLGVLRLLGEQALELAKCVVAEKQPATIMAKSQAFKKILNIPIKINHNKYRTTRKTGSKHAAFTAISSIFHEHYQRSNMSWRIGLQASHIIHHSGINLGMQVAQKDTQYPDPKTLELTLEYLGSLNRWVINLPMMGD